MAGPPFSLPTLGLSLVFKPIQIQIVMSRLIQPTGKYYRQFHEICDVRCPTYHLVGYTG